MDTASKLVKILQTILMILGWITYLLFWLVLFYTFFVLMTGGVGAIRARAEYYRQHRTQQPADNTPLYAPQVPTDENPESTIAY